MKKVLCGMISLLLLCACGKTNYKAEKVNEYYSSLTGISAQAVITVNSGLLAKYTIEYTRQEGQAKVTILEPKTLSGITASLNRGSLAIVFDQQSVEMLLPDLAGFLPVDSLDGVVELLTNSVPDDYVLEMKGERKTVALSYSQKTKDWDMLRRIWLDQENLAVVAAEFYLNGTMIMSMEVSQFTPV